MSTSLSLKLRDLRRALRSKAAKTAPLFDEDHLKQIAHHMPKTKEELGRLIPLWCLGAYGDRILEVTANHPRDQAAYEDCILEIGAFVRGGMPGMEVLNRVYPQILKHFEMEDEAEEVFEACKIYLNQTQNCLKRKRVVDEDTEPFCSQQC
jgi:hypothetical protein